MYGNKLAVAIKHNGKVLREFKDIIYLPFGAEYSIYIKNMDTVRALVKISIDGTDIGDGTEFVVPARGSIEIERFVKNGNFNQGNRFKFIERTARIENHRGIGSEDGIVVIEYKFEQRPPKTEFVIKKEIIEREYHDKWVHTPRRRSPDWPFPYNPPIIWCSNTLGGNRLMNNADTVTVNNLMAQNAQGVTFSANDGAQQISCSAPASAMSHSVMDSAQIPMNAINENGITVAGGVSDQQFHTVAWFPTEADSYTLVLRLLGKVETGKAVVEAITVKKKQKCTSCGHVNKASAKFCAACGTSLELI